MPDTTKTYALIVPLAGGGNVEGGAFTYESDEKLVAGQLVIVPLGKRKSLGIVLELGPQPEFATRPVERILELPPIPTPFIKLADWMNRYYASGPAATWTTLLPSGLEQKPHAKAVEKEPEESLHPLPPLTKEQAEVVEAINNDTQRRTHLLQGVTGSGKTRIYLELAAQSLKVGRSVVILVPEIMLTPQIIQTFQDHFGRAVIATHSRMTVAQRRNVWLQSQQSETPLIVIGPRSSLFVPVPKLGLIVIDECHETSYKQEQTPRYEAVPTAAKLAELTGAKLILGSATPGLNEVFLANEERIARHYLRQRINNRPAPVSTVVDLRDKDQLRTSRYLSKPLLDALEETLVEGRQSLLFINRRGSASSQICTSCGQTVMCPNCQLPLTLHADLMRLICHHCNLRQSPAAICPACGSSEMRYLGGGTKRVEAEVLRLFPAARLSRIDRDSATLQHMAATYKGLQDRTIDILIGTQMIAKGLDLPFIDTIGVVSADTMLQLPDYSGAERTFDLLVQVAGRAGRGDKPGRVIIQSYTPDHPAIRFAASGDFDGFAAAELEQRRHLHYPPYRYLLKLTVSSATRETSQKKADEFAKTLREQPKLIVLGPAPTLLETVGGKYQWMIAVKSAERRRLVEITRRLPSGWTADLDPLNLL